MNTQYRPSFATEELVFHGDESNTEGKALYFPVHQRKILIDAERHPDDYFSCYQKKHISDGTEVIYIGTLDGVPCYCFELKEELEEGNMQYFGLHDLYGAIDEEMLGIASRAVQMADFYRTHRYCGLCGGAAHYVPEETGMQCHNCNHITYPRISPAVIVLIEREDHLLMARSKNFPDGVYGLVAGFVEAGETIEHAAHREIKEEVGVSIKDLNYFASQPWPFPSSLMIGFTADFAEGKIEVDANEIEDACWFHVDDIPKLPGKKSISRALIDHFIDKHESCK
ncbi:NAD(+) diphosphatase [Methanococcoides orientis]|uniref:NAD(+) diphosphatase n=1 Tax=Methanococcoides orientis TaxID=2822137 RepID=UPI001E53FCD7|nr:NAD(+) diphosphatase [Methanococcoides orientis]UGV40652.1 NAD(+) diphosphatase [Methanococcoides orientis]